MNFDKTNVSISQGVRTDRRSRITHCLDIHEVLSHNKYLGLPTVVGRSKKKPFLFIVDHIKKQIGGWMAKLVSWTGKGSVD